MTKIRTQILRAKDFYNRPEIVKKASRLTMSEGNMNSLLEKQAPGNIILAWEGDTLLGWAYLNRERWDSSYNTHVYVRSSRRREGVGQRILTKAKNFASKQKRGLYGFPWNDQGSRLFEMAGVKCSTQDFKNAVGDYL